MHALQPIQARLLEVPELGADQESDLRVEHLNGRELRRRALIPGSLPYALLVREERLCVNPTDPGLRIPDEPLVITLVAEVDRARSDDDRGRKLPEPGFPGRMRGDCGRPNRGVERARRGEPGAERHL